MPNKFACIYPALYRSKSCILCIIYDKCTLKDVKLKKQVECKKCGFEFTVFKDYNPVRCPCCLLALDDDLSSLTNRKR